MSEHAMNTTLQALPVEALETDEMETTFRAFYVETNQLPIDEALGSCDAELAWATKDRQDIERSIGALPRSEKAKAKELTLRLMALEKHRKKVKEIRRHFQAMVDRRNRHGLWCAAITAVCGPDKLNDVFRWMKDNHSAAALQAREKD